MQFINEEDTDSDEENIDNNLKLKNKFIELMENKETIIKKLNI